MIVLYEVLTTMMVNTVLWDVILYSLAEVFHMEEEWSASLRLRIFGLIFGQEHGGSMVT